MLFAAWAVLAAMQEAAPTNSATPFVASAPSVCCTIPAGTPIAIEITDLVQSKSAKIGDHFGIRLAAALIIEGKTLLPAGTSGVGEVIHAAPRRLSGSPGELILAARYLEFDGARIPLRGFRISESGSQQTGMIFAAGTVAMYQSGHNIEVRAGMIAAARIAADVIVPPQGTPSTAMLTSQVTK